MDSITTNTILSAGRQILSEALKTSPDSGNGYGLALGVLVLVIAYLGVREWLTRRDAARYRDRKDEEDRLYRQQQSEKQEQHWKSESLGRDKFRRDYDQRLDGKFASIESSFKAFTSEVESILDEQQGQIAALSKRVDRLTWEIESKKPPKEGG